MDSIEILSNPATMQALAKSDEDIRNGKIKKISDVNDLLAELDYPLIGKLSEQRLFLNRSVIQRLSPGFYYLSGD